jgi:hypothetical protein
MYAYIPMYTYIPINKMKKRIRKSIYIALFYTN